MSTSFIIAIVVEILVGAFIVWGLLNEDRLVEIEDRLFAKVRALFKSRRTGKPTPPACDDIKVFGSIKGDSNCA